MLWSATFSASPDSVEFVTLATQQGISVTVWVWSCSGELVEEALATPKG
jgi:hypothetical protein